MTSIDYNDKINRRFADRVELSRDELLDTYFSLLEAQQGDVNELLDLLEVEFGVRAGLLRPEDRIDVLIGAPPTNNPLRWFEYQTRAGDAKAELNYRLMKRLERAGTISRWEAIPTVGALVRAWSGLPPL